LIRRPDPADLLARQVQTTRRVATDMAEAIGAPAAARELEQHGDRNRFDKPVV
jgi:hypothetical protein